MPPSPKGKDVECCRYVYEDPKIGGFVLDAATFRGELVYVGGVIRVTPSDSADGLCLFAASDIAQGAIRRVSLPDDADEAKALLVADTQLYVATAAQLPEGLRTRVCSTTNLVSWQAVAELTADARAYSIELLDGYLYIGLGGDHPSDGNVYRAKL